MGNVKKDITEAITAVGISPNETDRNLEAANLVDGLFEIARAIRWSARVNSMALIIAHAPERREELEKFLQQ